MNVEELYLQQFGSIGWYPQSDAAGRGARYRMPRDQKWRLLSTVGCLGGWLGLSLFWVFLGAFGLTLEARDALVQMTLLLPYVVWPTLSYAIWTRMAFPAAGLPKTGSPSLKPYALALKLVVILNAYLILVGTPQSLQDSFFQFEFTPEIATSNLGFSMLTVVLFFFVFGAFTRKAKKEIRAKSLLRIGRLHHFLS